MKSLPVLACLDFSNYARDFNTVFINKELSEKTPRVELLFSYKQDFFVKEKESNIELD